MLKKITRFEVEETVTLETLREPRFMLSVIYGRKRTERAKFKHQFATFKYANEMRDEMNVFVGMNLDDFLNHPKQQEIQKKFNVLHSPIIKMQPS